MNLGHIQSLLSSRCAFTLPARPDHRYRSKAGYEERWIRYKQAATSAGHGVSEGSKTTYDKTKSGTEKGYDKTKAGTEKGYDKTKAGTEKGYNKTAQGTRAGYHKTTQATKTGVHKVEGKPDAPANNPPQ